MDNIQPPIIAPALAGPDFVTQNDLPPLGYNANGQTYGPPAAPAAPEVMAAPAPAYEVRGGKIGKFFFDFVLGRFANCQLNSLIYYAQNELNKRKNEHQRKTDNELLDRPGPCSGGPGISNPESVKPSEGNQDINNPGNAAPCPCQAQAQTA